MRAGTEARGHAGTQARAFSMAELMIALAILGIGLLFIAAALPVGVQYTRETVDLSTAEAAAAYAFDVISTEVRTAKRLIPDTSDAPNVLPTSNGPQLPAGVRLQDFMNLVVAGRGVRTDNLFRPRMTPEPALPPAGQVDPYPLGFELREGSNASNRDEHIVVATPPPYELDQQDTRNDGYEPFIKVRPLTMSNISFDARNPVIQNQSREIVDDGEELIGRYLLAVSQGAARPLLHGLAGNSKQFLLEFDAPSVGGAALDPFLQLFQGYANNVAALYRNPGIGPLARVYPPLSPVRPFEALDYINPQAGNWYRQYIERNISEGVAGIATARGEFEKAAERRLAWTVFYRRVAYDSVRPRATGGAFLGPAVPQGTVAPAAADVYTPADPTLYEMIVVVTRRPSARHRYARQDVVSDTSVTAFERPRAMLSQTPVDSEGPIPLNATRGADRVAPTPWLVTCKLDTPVDDSILATDDLMQNLQRSTPPNAGTDHFIDQPLASSTGTTGPWDRALNSRTTTPNPFLTNPPPTLRFRVHKKVGQLLAAGSVLIPAANDDFPHIRGLAPFRFSPGALTRNFARPESRIAGFVPHAPNTLPIYEVQEVLNDASNPDAMTVVVKNNGAYPWLAPDIRTVTGAVKFFPFWVIPPSFVERSLDPDTGTQQPVYERRTSVVGVFRRVIRIPEIP